LNYHILFRSALKKEVVYTLTVCIQHTHKGIYNLMSHSLYDYCTINIEIGTEEAGDETNDVGMRNANARDAKHGKLVAVVCRC